MTKLVQWVDQNNIRVNVEKTFSLDEGGKALDYQKDVHPRGKVVLAGKSKMLVNRNSRNCSQPILLSIRCYDNLTVFEDS